MRWTAVPVVVALLSSCGGDSASPDVPDPDLSTAPEPAVARAVSEFREAVVQDPDSAQAWSGLGDLLARYGWMKEAGACYRSAEELEPDEFRWPYMRGVVLAGASPAEALRAVQRAIEIDPGYPLGHVRAGDLSIEADDLDGAEASFRRALQLDPANVEAKLRLGRLLLDTGPLSEADALLREALDAEPEHPEIHQALARACFLAGQPDRAQEHSERALEHARKVVLDDPRGRPQLKPISMADFVAAGIGAIQAGRPDEALVLFEEAVQRGPDDRDARNNYATCLAQVGRLPDSEKEFAELTRRFPGWLDPVLHRAAVLERMGRTRESFETLTAARARHPEDAALLGQLGQLLASQRRFEPAVEPLEAAIRHDDTPARRQLLASVFRQLQRWADAADVLRPALAAAPEDVGVRRQLVDCLGRAGGSAEALEECRLLSLDGPNRPTHLALFLQCLRGHAATLADAAPADAIRLYEEALAAQPAWQPALRGLSWLLATCAEEAYRDPARARSLAETLVAAVDSPDATQLDTLAAACAAGGDFTAAVEHSESAVRRARTDGNAALAERIAARLDGYRAGKPYVSTGR